MVCFLSDFLQTLISSAQGLLGRDRTISTHDFLVYNERSRRVVQSLDGVMLVTAPCCVAMLGVDVLPDLGGVRCALLRVLPRSVVTTSCPIDYIFPPDVSCTVLIGDLH